MKLDVDDEIEKDRILEEIGELKDLAPDEDGKKRLVPKDIIKENIGRSPDDLDNLIMRMWFVLEKKDDNKKFNEIMKHNEEDYTPTPYK